MTRSIARRHTAQKGTSSRVNMTQSTCGPVVARAPRTSRPRRRRPCRRTSRTRTSSSRSPAAPGRGRPSPLPDAARPGSRGGALWISRACFSNASLFQGVGIGVPGSTRSFHLSAFGSASAVTLASHGSSALRRRLVGHVRGVVLVGEAGEVMAELVDEDVRRPGAVGRDRRVEPEDAAAAVGPACSSGSRRTRRARMPRRREKPGSRR